MCIYNLMKSEICKNVKCDLEDHKCALYLIQHYKRHHTGHGQLQGETERCLKEESLICHSMKTHTHRESTRHTHPPLGYKCRTSQPPGFFDGAWASLCSMCWREKKRTKAVNTPHTRLKLGCRYVNTDGCFLRKEGKELMKDTKTKDDAFTMNDCTFYLHFMWCKSISMKLVTPPNRLRRLGTCQNLSPHSV